MRTAIVHAHPNPPARLGELSPEEQAIYASSIRPASRSTSPSSWTATAAGPASAPSSASSATSRAPRVVQFVVETASRIDLPWLTLYAFSLENNLRRPKSEVSFLMKLLKSYLVGNVKRMNDNNVRMAYIGRTQACPPRCRTPCSGPSESARKTPARP